MLVRRYSVISIFKDMCREKKMVIIIAIICTLLGGLLGFLTYQKESKEQISLEEQINSEYVEGEEDYITELRNYEESMAACEEAYAIAVEQRDILQKYIDNSIYMKIDSSNVQVAYVAYVVQDNANVGSILSALQSYINDGGLTADALLYEDDQLEINAWKEVMSVNVSGNNLFITIYHYDSDKIKQIMQVVKKYIETQTIVIEKVQGDFSLELVEESYFSKIDVNIANNQNGNNNNLRAYENSVADQLTKINSLTNTINDYKTKYKIEEGGSIQRGLPLTLLIYSIMGLVGSLLLSYIVMVIRISISNKIMSAQHLQYSGLTVYNVYSSKKKEFITSVDETVIELEKVTKSSGDNGLCLWLLSDVDTNKEVAEKLKDKIGLEVKENSGLCDCSDVLVVLTEKRDTYSALEELIAKCSRLDINLLGIVVSE